MDTISRATDAGRSQATGPKSTARRIEIIRTAIGIINARSYELATMREIAAALDLRDAALYYYYPSKQALAYAAHVYSLERFERTLELSFASPGTGLERLRHWLLNFLVESDENGPQLYFGEHSYLDESQRCFIDEWAGRLTGRIAAVVQDGIEDGSMRQCEVQLVVQLLLGMLIWLAKWTLSVDDLTPARLMQAIEDPTFAGLDARSPSALTATAKRASD